ncbi:MAG: hypothetical protein GY854_04010, partial [Deltaproteobacteria bacterium]|nr:hypothetical protein [Deltaproteobacteria bacterium]
VTELRYERPPHERASAMLSLLAWIIFLAGALMLLYYKYYKRRGAIRSRLSD